MNLDKDKIDCRVDDVRETFNALSDFVLTTYDDHGVKKEYWSETCAMLSKVSMQLLNLTKNHWETENNLNGNNEFAGPNSV